VKIVREKVEITHTVDNAIKVKRVKALNGDEWLS
jgi:hypothetical protein